RPVAFSLFEERTAACRPRLMSEVALPEPPVSPELPDLAFGFDVAVEELAPVLPVLVALDWAVDAPELPDWARGEIVRLTLPPAPPLASTCAIESPPTMLPMLTWLWSPLTSMPLTVTSPPESDSTELPLPPAPPLPPMPCT